MEPSPTTAYAFKKLNIISGVKGGFSFARRMAQIQGECVWRKASSGCVNVGVDACSEQGRVVRIRWAGTEDRRKRCGSVIREIVGGCGELMESWVEIVQGKEGMLENRLVSFGAGNSVCESLYQEKWYL